MTIVFDKIAFIGLGLIGGSMALDIKARGLAGTVTAFDINESSRRFIRDCEMVNELCDDEITAVRDADLIVLAVPVGAMASVASIIAPHLKNGAIVVDTGSSKQLIEQEVTPLIPSQAFFVPAHPVAGTEHSGPHASERDLFQNRWCILTPAKAVPTSIVSKVTKFWEALGMRVASMSAEKHDQILALTSHLPHLIAFSIVGTATELEKDLHDQVTLYSAGGFRDFTRIAASDAVMWRDIFLNNKDFLLGALQHFHDKLHCFTDAIEKNDAEGLKTLIECNREVRHAIIKAGQE